MKIRRFYLFTFLLFVFSVAFPSLHPLKVEKGKIVDGITGKPIWLFGVNLFETHLGWAISQEISVMERNLTAISKLGFNALRVPLNMSYIEPAPDIFPDNPYYSEIMHQHKLKDGFPRFLDALVQKAGELGLYVILEFHELPADPWRYFAGGQEQLRGSGKHGGAISWLAKIEEKDGKIEKVELDWDKAYEHVPKALAWLARHYKGNPTLAGIEVPWNEPVGGWAENENLYYKLVQACALAVKKEDPNRLVFMDIQDWGAGVNYLPPSSTWRTPPEVDVLFPHFYFGMHCPNTPYDEALRCAVANWTSWFTGLGKPVMVGEYGVAGLNEDWMGKHIEEMRKFYNFSGDKPDLSLLHRDVMRACLEQWKEMGIQGVFYWAWWEGIPGQAEGKRDLSLSSGFEVLKDFAQSFKNPRLTSAEAKIAVICDMGKRSQYGSPQDLLLISDILMRKKATPFHTIFIQAIKERRELLSKRKYGKIIILADELSDEIIQSVRKLVAKGRILIISQKDKNWTSKLEKFLEE
ncbi:cellulase family glycosylhydrolase [bacterium]|nr:cellulase family glycosylhydrolase [bacterium]